VHYVRHAIATARLAASSPLHAMLHAETEGSRERR
jgi:hypothetical protein